LTKFRNIISKNIVTDKKISIEKNWTNGFVMPVLTKLRRYRKNEN
jgi:hypothetical protein